MHPIDYIMQTAVGKISAVMADLVVQQNTTTSQPNFQFPDCIIAADTMVTLNYQNYPKRHDEAWKSVHQRESYEIIGKPLHTEDAIATLTKLSGLSHDISTGVCFMIPLKHDQNQDNKPDISLLTSLLGDILNNYDTSTIYDTNDSQYIHNNGLRPTFAVSKVDFASLPYQTAPTPCSQTLLSELNSGAVKHTPHQGTWYLIQFTATSSVIFDALTPQTIESYANTGEPLGKAGSYAIQGIGGSLVKQVAGCYQNIIGFPTNKFGTLLLGLVHPDNTVRHGFIWE
jgi:septum formation protein